MIELFYRALGCSTLSLQFWSTCVSDAACQRLSSRTESEAEVLCSGVGLRQPVSLHFKDF